MFSFSQVGFSKSLFLTKDFCLKGIIGTYKNRVVSLVPPLPPSQFPQHVHICKLSLGLSSLCVEGIGKYRACLYWLTGGGTDPMERQFKKCLSLNLWCGSGSGIRCLLTPGSGMGKKINIRAGPGMNILDHISEILETILWVKNTSLMRIRNILIWDPGWKNSDPGSGINIPNPQHWPKLCSIFL